MKVIGFGAPVVLAVALGLAAPAAPAGLTAQAPVTSADLQRLQDNIDDVSRDVAQLRTRDATLASRLESELADLRDDAVYLRVKLRRNESIARSEYADLRDRIENIRSRSRGGPGDGSAAPGSTAGTSGREPEPAPSASRSRTTSDPDADVPVGTELDVRLQTRLNSGTARVEERFDATTVVDLMDGDRVLIPAGSMLRGMVSSVTSAGRVERKGSLTVSFDQITIRGRGYPIRATVTEALESEGIRGEAARIGTGAGVGAIIGGILGGFKGALAGILIGGGGTIAATEGTEVDLPSGTVLRVRMDTELNLR